MISSMTGFRIELRTQNLYRRAGLLQRMYVGLRAAAPRMICAARSLYQPFKDAQIVGGHARDAEPAFELPAARRAANLGQMLRGVGRFVDARADAPIHSVLDQLGHGPTRPGNHGRSTSYCFSDDQPERLWPIDGKKQRSCTP